MTDEEVEAQEFGEQMEVAAHAIRTAVVQLLQAGEVHPQFIILAVAKVAGELGAATALASGQEAEELLDELADIVRQSGRDHQETIKVAMLPAAGNA
jgi:hypothetical protein